MIHHHRFKLDTLCFYYKRMILIKMRKNHLYHFHHRHFLFVQQSKKHIHTHHHQFNHFKDLSFIQNHSVYDDDDDDDHYAVEFTIIKNIHKNNITQI